LWHPSRQCFFPLVLRWLFLTMAAMELLTRLRAVQRGPRPGSPYVSGPSRRRRESESNLGRNPRCVLIQSKDRTRGEKIQNMQDVQCF
jgi:hypothetical protein